MGVGRGHMRPAPAKGGPAHVQFRKNVSVTNEQMGCRSGGRTISGDPRPVGPRVAPQVAPRVAQ